MALSFSGDLKLGNVYFFFSPLCPRSSFEKPHVPSGLKVLSCFLVGAVLILQWH